MWPQPVPSVTGDVAEPTSEPIQMGTAWTMLTGRQAPFAQKLRVPRGRRGPLRGQVLQIKQRALSMAAKDGPVHSGLPAGEQSQACGAVPPTGPTQTRAGPAVKPRDLVETAWPVAPTGAGLVHCQLQDHCPFSP